ncbi:MAG TPA: ribose 5-phosphate isomerase B [Gemmatimonadales bacterium]|nr:ribose 5-phosphate isomerase B [Gemmatimonadales bacterium]
MSRRPLVTEAQVREAARAGAELRIPAGSLVTPAARDAAEQLGVTLKEESPPAAAEPSSLEPPAPDRRAPTPVAIASDHGGFNLKQALKPVLEELGCDVVDLGTDSTEPVDYPDYAVAVARSVQEGRTRFGIMVDGAGIGSAMVANKIAGVRAALCYDVTTAHNAREHNDANVLTLGGALIGPRLAAEIVRTFLTTDFGGGRHQRRVDKINQLDSRT